ncbi:helix-turn-helix transcriptional regulator [Sphingobacterium spiritivorum]|uniref:helix-turn-helix transcriptional regulator n=1 Tax=Sphingobacterium spiritivorum TaxID=258 RepID=UPI003DA60BA1
MNNNLPDNEKSLWILKTKGALPLTALAKEMGVTTEGARFHLLKLANEGLVASTTESKGRGRPQQIWELTPKGQSRFPDTHADLTVNLIRTIRETLGEKALQQIIKANGEEILDRYTQHLSGIRDLEPRIEALVDIRQREGYMAEYRSEADGEYLFIENHCPICAAATQCQGFCDNELTTFRTVLGTQATVDRISHIVAGARRCAYVIKQKE